MTRVFGEDSALLAQAGNDVEELRTLERQIEARLPVPAGVRVDAHTHLGRDTDGHHLAPADLIADLDRFHFDAAVAFPANDPGADGRFTDANTEVLAAARADPGRILPFVRLDPKVASTEALQGWHDRGARGLKLHPVAQQFRPEAPESIALVAGAGALGLPVLIHAGFGARALAGPVASLSEHCPQTRLILAHGGRGDAAALWEAVRPNPLVWFDTSLATVADLVEIPPARLVFGSDRPYGDYLSNLVLVSAVARQARWSEAEFAGVLGTNLLGILKG